MSPTITVYEKGLKAACSRCLAMFLRWRLLCRWSSYCWRPFKSILQILHGTASSGPRGGLLGGPCTSVPVVRAASVTAASAGASRGSPRGSAGWRATFFLSSSPMQYDCTLSQNGYGLLVCLLVCYSLRCLLVVAVVDAVLSLLSLLSLPSLQR